MLDAAVLDDMGHPDRLQRELALTFARALHCHECTRCRQVHPCTVIDCEYRKFPVREREYECFLCRGLGRGVEWAVDEATGGGDE